MAKSHKPGVHDEGKHPILSTQEKPALDEETFQQLLQAAHVLQQQKGPEVPYRPQPDPTDALAQIVETQEFLRSQPSDLYTTANLIVERLQKITRATGAAVAVVREDQLEYCAATGDAAGLAGSRRAMASSLSADGQLSTQFSREHAEKQSMALPLLHDGTLAGLLEVCFADAGSIPEPEMRSCQLMAGLMTEAIARAADQEWKHTLAAERAAMLEALERIKPQLERLAVEPAKVLGPAAHAVEPTPGFVRTAADAVEVAKQMVKAAPEKAKPVAGLPMRADDAKSHGDCICPQCGYQFGEHELFCGRCGTARPETLPTGDLQSKWASMWHMQQAAENRHEPADNDSEERKTDLSNLPSLAMPERPLAHESANEVSAHLSPELEKMLAQFSHEAEEAEAAKTSDAGLVISGQAGEDEAATATAVVEPRKPVPPWGSATNTRKWLESLNAKSPARIWLAKHRADIYVGAAIVLLLLAWGMRSPDNHAQVKNPPQPSLTLLEKLMVSLGLAEKPTVPVYLGNPNASVWVDLHTALYYCADSEFYGKTPGGKFTTQRDAQLDQFEPAARKNCD